MDRVTMPIRVAMEISKFYSPINYIKDGQVKIPITHLDDKRIVKAIQNGKWRVIYNGG